jgi:hypothetical protein
MGTKVSAYISSRSSSGDGVIGVVVDDEKLVTDTGVFRS